MQFLNKFTCLLCFSLFSRAISCNLTHTRKKGVLAIFFLKFGIEWQLKLVMWRRNDEFWWKNKMRMKVSECVCARIHRHTPSARQMSDTRINNKHRRTYLLRAFWHKMLESKQKREMCHRKKAIGFNFSHSGRHIRDVYIWFGGILTYGMWRGHNNTELSSTLCELQTRVMIWNAVCVCAVVRQMLTYSAIQRNFLYVFFHICGAMHRTLF